MWALRRVSHPLRNRGLGIRASSIALPNSEQSSIQIQLGVRVVESTESASDTCLSFKGFYRQKHDSSGRFLVGRGLSSQAGAKGSEEDDGLEDRFSQDEGEDGYDDDETSKNDIEMSDTEIGLEQKAPARKKVAVSLVKAMIATKGISIRGALDRWVEGGNKLGRGEVYLALSSLRKFGMYGRAQQFLEWVQAGNRMEFTEKDYSTLLDLIAKVQGLVKAEKYIDNIPKSFRGELVYRTLLANCVQSNNANKAEQLFNKMKDLELPLSVFTCNQLLLLYKRTNKKKVADVLLLMENANLKPNIFTYKLLIDIKGKFNDIQGIQDLLETMEAEGVKQDLQTKSIVTKHYISAGLKEKAKAILKEMEGDSLRENRQVSLVLLERYAELGEADEVGRVWKVCEENVSSGHFLVAVRAWGKLKEVEKAEAVFETMLKVLKKPTSLHYNSLLRVYAENKMLDKGKHFIKRMAENGVKVGPLAWDSLLKLYTEAGLIHKADEILQKASQQNYSKPLLFRSYLVIMNGYADRGDVPNAEKIFRRMREAGYMAKVNQFETLIRAYINAKAPAYGMRERMKADNLFPNKFLASQLAKVDSFMITKTSISDLFD